MAGKDKASALVTMVHGWEKTARKLARNAKIDLIKSNLYFTTSNVISFSSAISNQMKWFEFSKQKFHKIFTHIQHYCTGQRNKLFFPSCLNWPVAIWYGSSSLERIILSSVSLASTVLQDVCKYFIEFLFTRFK